MKRLHRDSIRYRLALSVLCFSGIALAQEPSQDPQQAPPPPPQTSDSGGWKHIGDGNGPAPLPAQNTPPPATLPSQLTIKPGTYVTVRINQPLSSDRNQVGDAFSATLIRPIIVDGWVVAERGQTLGGRVSEAQKAGRVSGVSKLGVQLTDIPLADGQQVPVTTQLISRQGPTSTGRDAAAIAGTTAFGAAVGSAAAWGTGAAWGAGAGFVAATIGVLLTRGHPTILYPESVLTFRIDQPVTISTEHAPQTFRPVEPGDYQTSAAPRLQTRGPGYPPPSAYYGPAYYPYPYPYYWGAPFYGGVFFGPRVFFGRRW